MTFYEALCSELIEDVYSPELTVLNPRTGDRISIGQAVKTSLLGHNTCLVFDSELTRQVGVVISSPVNCCHKLTSQVIGSPIAAKALLE